jgi:uncharacterized protein YoxC
MDVLIQILTVILILSAALLCIALIYYLNKIVKSVQSVNSDIKELSSNLKPLIQSTLTLSDSLNRITSDVKDQLHITQSIVVDLRERADKVLNLESRIRSSFEDAVMPFVQNLHAIGRGVETFWRNFKNK